ILWRDAGYDLAETKCSSQLQGLGITGYGAEKWWRGRWNSGVELSDLYNILCIVGPGDTPEMIDTLVEALAELSREYYHPNRSNRACIRLPEIPELVVSPRDAFYAKTTTVPFEESAGKIMAERPEEHTSELQSRENLVC